MPGYFVRQQDADLKYMLAFGDPSVSLNVPLYR